MTNWYADCSNSGVLQLTRLDRVIALHPDVDSAVREARPLPPNDVG